MPLKVHPPRKGKSPYYSVRGTHRGIYVDRSTKTTEAKKAKQICQKWQDDIERRFLTGPSLEDKKKALTFLDAAVSYMAADGEQRFLKKPVNALGSLAITEITQNIIDEESVKAYPTASAAARNRQFYTPVSAVLRHAGCNLALRRPKGAQGKQKTRWLTVEEAQQFIAAAEKIDTELATLYTLALYTGMRRNELFSLKVLDVHLNERFAYVHTTKNSTPRLVHLPPTAVASLSNHLGCLDKRGPRVFRFSPGGRFSTFTNNVREALPAQFSDVTLHTLRHTWATWMRRYGELDTRGLVDTGAWKDMKSAMRYEHVVVSEEAKRADLLPDISRETRGKSVEKRRKAS